MKRIRLAGFGYVCNFRTGKSKFNAFWYLRRTNYFQYSNHHYQLDGIRLVRRKP